MHALEKNSISSIFLTFLLYIVLRLTVYRKLDPGKYGKKVTSEEKEEKDMRDLAGYMRRGTEDHKCQIQRFQ